MTPQEMQMRSRDKVKQVLDLMKMLHLKVEARERIDKDGFIEKIVFWLDEEKYPQAPKEAAAVNNEAAPALELGQNNA